MSNFPTNMVELDMMNEKRQVFQERLLSSMMMTQFETSSIHRQMQNFCMDQRMKEEGKRASGITQECTNKPNDGSTVEKLKVFFECLQKQHPESRLELQFVDHAWKVWCGACKKLLRPDKSGKALHNIQRQHFSSSRHKKNLHLMLSGEDETKHKIISEQMKASM